MDVTCLKAFICIAECGSFSKAEEKLFLSKQALIRQINALEKEIGAMLISRNSQGVLLTNAGECFYEGAKEILQMVDRVKVSCRNIDSTGKLTIILEQDYVNTPFTNIVYQYVRKYPNIPIEHIQIPNGQRIQSILDGSLSAWFCYYQPYLDTGGLRYTHLFYETLWCIMQPDHPLAQKAELTIEDIKPYQLIAGSDYWAARINETLREELTSGVQIVRSPTIAAYTKLCMNGALILCDKWKCDHVPIFASRPIRTALNFSFGIATRQDCTEATELFIQTALECIESSQ